ncbi:MAG: ATP synthase F1 subunit gamma [Bacteroidales bacterium]|nr:ATP synthase F1 subunit gamma [Bacteroidales bacterium]
MPTLKEIKGRIASVRSTLKITSAMKLVSSAKLRKAQMAIEAMRPYQEQLQGILTSLQGSSAMDKADFMAPSPENAASASNKADFTAPGTKTIVAIASDSSLCGSFNANAVAKVRSIRQPGDTVYAIGRKMADAMRRDGFASPADCSSLSEHPSYSDAAALADKLAEEAGHTGTVVLVYNHFVSTARQEPVVEVLVGAAPQDDDADAVLSAGEASAGTIFEPSRKELLATLLPKTRKLKLYAALLDSAAAEHAARTVAMQTATDNAEDLLAELTLQYNKGRQQKITAEILDLAGGQAEN